MSQATTASRIARAMLAEMEHPADTRHGVLSAVEIDAIRTLIANAEEQSS